MARQIFVNLPVKNVQASKEFFHSLGFVFNAQFSGPTGSCMVVSETIYVMLLGTEFFQSFTPKSIADASKSTEVLVCLSCSSRHEVDSLVRKAVAAGGRIYKEPQEHGHTMYGHGFEDLDGHLWELVYMAPPAEQK